MASKKLIRATGRRKESVASVILRPGTGKRIVNGREFSDYFTSETQMMVVELPFAALENGDKWDVSVNAKGGGINGQVGATKLGIARALVKINEEDRSALRAKGLLTRDAREVERKKYGRKKARKRFQFSKR
ncbi:MAG: 30S ribosomal protein S9 [Fibrobacterales bacterium]